MKKLVRNLGLTVGLATAIAACYKPDIPDGSIGCGGKNLDQCPDGYSCFNGTCHKGSAGGTGGTIGTGGTGGSTGTCIGPLPGTTYQDNGAACDPVSQFGCKDCSLRCNIVGTTPTCQNPPTAPAKKNGELCAFQPTDTCDVGLICLPELQDVCGAHCYRFCRSDANCTEGSHCSVPLSVNDMALTQFVCDVPPANCLPFKGTAESSPICSKGEGFGCYLAGAKYPEEVVCDCAGTLDEGRDCKIERAECKPGLICVAGGGGGESPKCRAVCPVKNPTLAAKICNGGSCVPYGGSSKYGYCR